MLKDYDAEILYKNLRIIQLPDLIHHEQCKLGYKISNKLLSKLLLDMFNKHGDKKSHPYPAGSKNVPNIQKHKDLKLNTSFLCKSLMNYMQLPGITRSAGSLNSFNRQVKARLVY